jgi:outer membrane receptor protein involved in Fe transport
MRLALGGAFRRESFFRTGEILLFGQESEPLLRADTERDVVAVFGEVVVPLFGSANARPGLKRLELSAALRHERYDDFGSSTNPRIGLVWEPLDGVRLRGSYGTSFRAPGLRELNDPTNVGISQLPDENGNLNTVLFLTGGNPDLEAERARSLTLGIQVAPPSLSGFRAEATYFDTRFSNRIGQPAFEDRQLVLRDEAFSPFVTFVDPANNPADRALVEELSSRPGSTVPPFFPRELFGAIVDGRYVNTARVLVRGLDFLLTQRFQLGGGNASVAANASYILDFRRQPTPTASPRERVDTVGNPTDLRMRLTGNWDRDAFGATFSLNYADEYRDDVSQPERKVDSWLTVDAQLRYQPNWRGVLSGTSLSLSVQNLFNSDPPFVNRPPGQAYDAANADPLGRFVALQIIKSW